jgi:hypothetical protein
MTRARLKFPTFNDKEDPLPWLNHCESFFRGQNTPECRRVWYTAMHLAGATPLWFYRLEMASGTPSCNALRSWCSSDSGRR